MTTRTLKRGGPARRPTVKRRSKPKQSFADRMIARVPVEEATLKRWATAGFVTIGAGALVVGAMYAGVPGMATNGLGEAAGRAGFRLDEVQAPGLRRMNFLTVNAIVLEQQTRALPLIDLELIRARLLQQGWVKDAEVSRRYPNKIVVRITERTPAAVWQSRGQLTLVDAEGVQLAPVDRNAIPDLPLLIGPAANLQAPGYQRLIAAAPALRPRIVAATWIDNRRWNLRVDSGETLKLPEDGAEAALLDFAKRDGAHPLLGRGWVSFDLRFPGKMIVRRPPTGAERQVADPDAPGGGHANDNPGNGGMEG